MSGHSKWSQIKRQKGVADAKKGQIFTKLGNAITIAVREGGGIADPDSNFKLRLIIEKARINNMPKENIQRAIERATGKGEGGDLQEATFEAFGPFGVAIIIETVTDNHLRTQAEIKNLLNHMGGNLAGIGSVSYLFNKSGLITIQKQKYRYDDIFLLACDAGASDVEETEDFFDIYTKPQDLHKLKKIIEEHSLPVVSAELIMQPINTVVITEKEKSQKIIDLLEALEGLDDVQKVYSNIEISEYEKN